MNDREKQIEEMTEIMSNTDCAQASIDYLITALSENKSFKGIDTQKFIDSKKAEALYRAGYRKMDEVSLKLDLGDRSAEEIQQIVEAFNKVMANEQTLVTVPNNGEEITKRVAQDILQDWYDDVVHGMGVDGYYIKEYAKKYGVEIEE